MGEKNVERSPMRARTAIAALLAATVALPLAGCFGLPGLDDVADQAEDFASQAQELADTLSDVDWGKVSRLVVRDARTGEVVRELTDQDQIEGAFEPLSDESGLAAEPGADAEYVFELWQPGTQKAGQDAADLDEVKVLEVTTYEGSPAVARRGARGEPHRSRAPPHVAARRRRAARARGVALHAADLPLHALGQLGEDEVVAHVAEVEHEPLGKAGVQVDGDPRAPVGAVAGENRARVLGAQLQDAVGVALEREQVAPRVGRPGVGRGDELAGELPAAHPVDQRPHFSWRALVAPGRESRRASMRERSMTALLPYFVESDYESPRTSASFSATSSIRSLSKMPILLPSMPRLTEAILSVITKLVRSSPFSSEGSTLMRVGMPELSNVVIKQSTTESKPTISSLCTMTTGRALLA